MLDDRGDAERFQCKASFDATIEARLPAHLSIGKNNRVHSDAAGSQLRQRCAAAQLQIIWMCAEGQDRFDLVHGPAT